MSSTYSDSDSKKVYRQPEKPTIQDVIAAWKEIESKVEELLEKQVHDHDVTMISTKEVVKAARANLEKVEFTVWEKLVRVVTSGQRSPEDEKRMVTIEYYEKTIKEQNTQLSTIRNATLNLAHKVKALIEHAILLVDSWIKTMNAYAAQDRLAHSITTEELVHIQAITHTMPGYRRTRSIKCVLDHIIYILDTNTSLFEEHTTIGRYDVKSDLHLDWIYEYKHYRHYCIDWSHQGESQSEPRSNPHTNQEIKNVISTYITILEQAARFFSPPLSYKPSTQTA
jgi:hypothetical protein